MTALLTVFWSALFTVFLSVTPMGGDKDGIECMEMCIENAPTCGAAADCIMQKCVHDEEDEDDDDD